VIKQSRLPLFFVLLCLIASCASGGRKEQAGLRQFLQTGQYDQAIELIKSGGEYKEERSRLLVYLERAIVFHRQGKFYQSSLELEKARELGDKLYTESISAKAKTLIANDAYDVYYGEKYEHSLIRFYQALNHYLIWQSGKYEAYSTQDGETVTQVPEKILSDSERRQELFRARAAVLDWDSFLTTLRNERVGQTVFKNDLLAKIFGAQIHEALATNNDRQAALQLYRDAKELLFKNYNGYASFNTSSRKFRSDFSKLPEFPRSKIEKEYVTETDHARDLLNYLDKKIASKLKSAKGKSAVTVVLQRGFIPEKSPELQYFGLDKALNDPKAGKGSKALAAVGHVALTFFMADVLKLMPTPQNYTPVGAQLGFQVAAFTAEKAAISFELPVIKNAPLSQRFLIRVLSLADRKMVTEQVLPLVGPLGDIAEEAVAEGAIGRYTRVGTRLATKHAAAILASYATYKLVKDKSGDLFARSAAVLQYLAVARGIQETEKADTRYWSTLPEEIRVADLELAPGQYIIQLLSWPLGAATPFEAPVREVSLGVDNSKNRQLINVVI
jgi:hypothetical protein